jgi:hypothetical protein
MPRKTTNRTKRAGTQLQRDQQNSSKKKNKQQLAAEYRYGKKAVLRPGDRFRVSKGPYHVLANGKKVGMAERGEFVFIDYFEADHCILARSGKKGECHTALLWVGPEIPCPKIPGTIRRPYRIQRVRAQTNRAVRRRPRRQSASLSTGVSLSS